MTKSLRIGLVAGLLAVSLAACQSGPSNRTIGQVGGAAAGGLLGSQIGSGTGQLAAVAAGTLLGAYLGGELADAMTQQDQQQAASTAQNAFEYQPSGSSSQWSNPDSGNQGTVTPTQTYQRNGTYCRDYTSTVTIDGRTEYATGTACRQPDGTWRIVDSSY